MNLNQQLKNWIVLTLKESAWAPLCIIGFYIVALAIGLFELYPPLDIPSHLVGGIAITYFYRSAIRNSQTFLREIPNPVQVLLAFTATGTTVIFWEFYEYTLDFFMGTQKVRGVQDIMVDMFFGLLGALLLSLFYRRQS